MIEDRQRCKTCGLYQWQTHEEWEPEEYTCDACAVLERAQRVITERKGPKAGKKLGLIHGD